ncbi:MAG: NAD(P)/FAD-dependent oxidoreductase [Eubacteriales bacterium]
MSKKIIVAGAGHGGLVAAAYLAEQGYEATVFEKLKREDLGYDWHDTIGRDTFLFAGIEDYDKKDIRKRPDSTFYAPSLKTPVSFDIEPDKADIEVDRKVIYDYLISNAEKKGVKIYYSSNITAPLLDENNNVAGIIVDGKEINADMVIDSAGLNSPLISQLPAKYCIKNNYSGKDIFHAYRAYYNLVDGIEIKNKNRFNIYFKFGGIKGIAWFKISEGQADVLVGSVDPLNFDIVETMLNKLCVVQPAIGSELLRGGQIKDIPIKSTFSLLVGNNYAAIGDAVSMPVPLNGSGITNSIRAGVMLADTIINIDKAKNPYSTSKLWDYQVKYYREIANKMISICILKNCLLGYSEKVLNFLFDREILTAKELSAGGNGKEVVMGRTETLDKLKKGYSRPISLLKLKSAVKKSKAARKLAAEIPEVYDAVVVEKWRKKLEQYLK